MRNAILAITLLAITAVAAPRPAAAQVSLHIGQPGFSLHAGPPIGPPVVVAPPAVAYGPPVYYGPRYYEYKGHGHWKHWHKHHGWHHKHHGHDGDWD
jgi:hypothetical protein